MTEERADVFGQVFGAIGKLMKRYPGKIQVGDAVVNGHRELRVRVIEDRLEADLDEISRDVVDVVRRAGHRLKTEEVISRLKMAGKVHSESAVRHTLAQLVKSGILSSRKDTDPRGYGPAEWSGGTAEN